MGRRLFQALRYSADGFRLEDFRQGQAFTSEIGGEDGVDGHRQIHTIAVDIGSGGNGYRLAFSRAPPLLPSEMSAVLMTQGRAYRSTSRCVALTMPELTASPRPRGLPMA